MIFLIFNTIKTYFNEKKYLINYVKIISDSSTVALAQIVVASFFYGQAVSNTACP